MMKPISAEDFELVWLMSNKKVKILGITIIFTAFLISAFNSLLVTNFSILDTDASTYIIVVMLMLFAFIIFSAKADLDFEYNRNNIIYSSLIFVLYILLLSFLRVSLSSAFLSYRIDALLFPLPLLALIVLVFGLSGAKKLYPLIIYAAFASPLIIMPLLNLTNAFANLNAVFVYGVLKGIGVQVSKVGLMISSNLVGNITISSTCTSLGTFVAFIMFLMPLAYLYDGRLRNKVYWIVSGTLLILALNFIRMLSIAIVWAYYGLNNAVSTYHLFAGQLIFYVAIILMVLLAYKYGLNLRKARKGTLNDIKTFYRFRDNNSLTIIVIALVFAVVAFAFNSGYGNDLHASAALFAKGTSKVVVDQQVLSSIENAGSNIAVLNSSNSSTIFLLGNLNAGPNESVYAITNVSYSPFSSIHLPGYIPIGRANSYLLKNGVTITAQGAYSGNTIFDVNYFSLPYNFSGGWLMVNYIIFKRADTNSSTSCNLINYGTIGFWNYLESVFYNSVARQSRTGVGFLCQSYLIASSDK